jgi:hypothetical protein
MMEVLKPYGSETDMETMYQLARKTRRRIPREIQREIVRKLARHYNVKVRFLKNIDNCGAGYAEHSKTLGHRITIWSESKFILDCFFHELGHCHCWDTGKWPTYHSRKFTTPTIIGLIRTGWKAEKWVDQWAIQEKAKWYPNHEYRSGYRTPEGKKWLHDNYLSWFKDKLKRRLKRKSQRKS